MPYCEGQSKHPYRGGLDKGSRRAYLPEQVSRQVLVDAECSPLLCNAGGSDNRGHLDGRVSSEVSLAGAILKSCRVLVLVFYFTFGAAKAEANVRLRPSLNIVCVTARWEAG